MFYWQREVKNSQAEVYYVIQKGENLVSLKVKSGKEGTMQSLYLFLKEKKVDKGVRVSLENFGSVNNIDIYPLYTVNNILKS